MIKKLIEMLKKSDPDMVCSGVYCEIGADCLCCPFLDRTDNLAKLIAELEATQCKQ